MLAVLLTTTIPLTLHRPLTGDASVWQLLARTVERGDAPYRDVFETNLPGAVWLHLSVRRTLGPSPEALRLFDLLLFAVVSGVLSVCVGRVRGSVAAGVWTAAVLWACYAGQSIWCQCQRDVWMLALALAAVAVRGDRVPDDARRSAVEGLLWGVAASMKPFVLLVAIAVELTDRRRTLPSWAAAVGGVLAVATANVALLVSLGAWPSAFAIWTEWNPDYFASRTRLWNVRGLRMLLVQFGPWMAIHLTALPLAIWTLAVRRTADSGRLQRTLAALYLAWTAQAFLLQQWHAYVHVPGLLLGIACVAAEPLLQRAVLWRPAALAFVAAACWYAPPVRASQLAVWPECLGQTVTASTRDRLRGPLDPVYPAGPTTVDLERVVGFLNRQDLGDREFLSYGFATAVLYERLDVRPASRFVTPRFHAIYFPTRRGEVLESIERSPVRFVVTDLVVEGQEEAGADELCVRPEAGFPWGHPVVFRAGRYRVHAIERPLGVFVSPEFKDGPARQEGHTPHSSAEVPEPRVSSTRTTEGGVR